MSCYFFVLFSFTFGRRISHPPFVLFFSINIFMRGFLSKKKKKIVLFLHLSLVH